MRAIFYSANGFIWYWGRYSREDVAKLKFAGWKVAYDTTRFRGKLR
jgi:hypothetical protein